MQAAKAASTIRQRRAEGRRRALAGGGERRRRAVPVRPLVPQGVDHLGADRLRHSLLSLLRAVLGGDPGASRGGEAGAELSRTVVGGRRARGRESGLQRGGGSRGARLSQNSPVI